MLRLPPGRVPEPGWPLGGKFRGVGISPSFIWLGLRDPLLRCYCWPWFRLPVAIGLLPCMDRVGLALWS